MNIPLLVVLPDDSTVAIAVCVTDSEKEVMEKVIIESDTTFDTSVCELRYLGELIEPNVTLLELGISAGEELELQLTAKGIALKQLQNNKKCFTCHSFHKEIEYFGDDVVTYIQAGVDVNETNEDGETSFHVAAGNSNIHALKLIYPHVDNANTIDKDYQNALHLATSCQASVETLTYLIEECNIDINALDRWGDSPMWSACSFPSRPESCKLLIRHGVELNRKNTDKQQQTPLTAAVAGGCMETVKLILENGGRIQEGNAKWPNDIIEAMTEGVSSEMFSLLLDYSDNVDVNLPSNCRASKFFNGGLSYYEQIVQRGFKLYQTTLSQMLKCATGVGVFNFLLDHCSHEEKLKLDFSKAFISATRSSRIDVCTVLLRRAREYLESGLIESRLRKVSNVPMFKYLLNEVIAEENRITGTHNTHLSALSSLQNDNKSTTHLTVLSTINTKSIEQLARERCKEFPYLKLLSEIDDEIKKKKIGLLRILAECERSKTYVSMLSDTAESRNNVTLLRDSSLTNTDLIGVLYDNQLRSSCEYIIKTSLLDSWQFEEHFIPSKEDVPISYINILNNVYVGIKPRPYSHQLFLNYLLEDAIVGLDISLIMMLHSRGAVTSHRALRLACKTSDAVVFELIMNLTHFQEIQINEIIDGMHILEACMICDVFSGFIALLDIPEILIEPSLLLKAVQQGRDSYVAVLLRKGVSAKLPIIGWLPPLIISSLSLHANVSRILIENGGLSVDDRLFCPGNVFHNYTAVEVGFHVAKQLRRSRDRADRAKCSAAIRALNVLCSHSADPQLILRKLTTQKLRGRW